jgi:DNA-binding MarR family transcriptional regulator
MEATTVVDGLQALSRAVIAITTTSLNQLDLDVTLTQYRTMVVLAGRGPQHTADLATELGIKPSTATRLCDRLVHRGLVQRRQGHNDRRVVWVLLTDSGKELVGRAMNHRRKLLQELIGQMSIRDTTIAAKVFLRLAQAGGELSESQWWDNWHRSASMTDIPAKAV